MQGISSRAPRVLRVLWANSSSILATIPAQTALLEHTKTFSGQVSASCARTVRTCLQMEAQACWIASVGSVTLVSQGKLALPALGEPTRTSWATATAQNAPPTHSQGMAQGPSRSACVLRATNLVQKGAGSALQAHSSIGGAHKTAHSALKVPISDLSGQVCASAARGMFRIRLRAAYPS